MSKTKQFTINKHLVMQAYELVKENAGAAGIDEETIAEFECNLKDNLYKLWNRMSSGSYFPAPVKAVPIPKRSGGKRILGIPTVSDRIAQTVVKLLLDPILEPEFHENSYGYRTGKSALDAVGITRERCWKYDWVLEFDIKGAFDNLDHELLIKALEHHTNDKMIILYVKRWLVAPLKDEDGKLTERNQGVPQGSVIGPVLMNLFMHYAFDKWMDRNYPANPFARYADDGITHCRSEGEAEQLKEALLVRFRECSLELHPDKTKIIYCKDTKRKGKYKNQSFDFLGYTFRPRKVVNGKTGAKFTGFIPAVSKEAIKQMCQKTRKSHLRNRSDMELKDLARRWNPVLQGWFNYYGKYCKSEMYKVCRHFNKTIISWAMRKYKSLNKRKKRAMIWLGKVSKENPNLFVHWRMKMVGPFA